MRKGLVICSLLLAPLAFGADHGRTAAPNTHSNSTAASSDHDKGKERAADVGKGKKKGLKKLAFWQKKPKS